MSTLIVLAKAPVPGRVKTRLCPPFTPRQAAGLAEAALTDTLRAVRACAADNLLLFLDGEPGPWLPKPRNGQGIGVAAQPGGGLDERIAAAFAAAARRDPGPALLIGMDTPQVDPDLLDEALRLLHGEAQAVFGPAEDGGFWALGLDSRHNTAARAGQLVLGVPMSVPETGRTQLRRLHDAGLRVAVLPALRDVDTAADAHAAAALIPDSRFAARLAEYAPPADGPPAPAEPASPTAGPWAGSVLSAYERALWESLSHPPAPVLLHAESGHDFVLDVARYAAPVDAADDRLLARCTGPTLDIGCGPGRLAAELAHRGVPALGVDAAPIAVLLARAAGATALRRSVFDRLPGEGRWRHALLIDGNIGIGGDPEALFARIRTLLAVGGELVVEAAAGTADDRSRLRTGDHDATMPWARLGTEAVRKLAAATGYTADHEWATSGRHFIALSTRPDAAVPSGRAGGV
jgi:rSAM/selenodomain-associated transferase 1